MNSPWILRSRLHYTHRWVELSIALDSKSSVTTEAKFTWFFSSNWIVCKTWSRQSCFMHGKPPTIKHTVSLTFTKPKPVAGFSCAVRILWLHGRPLREGLWDRIWAYTRVKWTHRHHLRTICLDSSTCDRSGTSFGADLTQVLNTLYVHGDLHADKHLTIGMRLHTRRSWK